MYVSIYIYILVYTYIIYVYLYFVSGLFCVYIDITQAQFPFPSCDLVHQDLALAWDQQLPWTQQITACQVCVEPSRPVEIQWEIFRKNTYSHGNVVIYGYTYIWIIHGLYMVYMDYIWII